MMFKKFVLSMFIAGMIPSAHAQLISEKTLGAMGEGLKCWAVINSVGLTGVVVHEYGHALAGKLMYGNKINIHIGNYEKKGYKIPFFGIIVHPVDSYFKWEACARRPLNQTSLIKNTIIAASGPMAGMLFGACMLKYSNNVIIQSAGLYCIGTNGYHLIPYGSEEDESEGDGYKIMRNLGIGTEKLKMITKVTNRKYFLFIAEAVVGLSAGCYLLWQK